MIRVENMRKVALAAIPMVLILAACSSSTPEQTVVVVSDAPAATELPAEVPTAVPIAPTPGSGDPTLIAKVNTAVRSGPGTNYPILFHVAPGTIGEISGKSADGQWYQFVGDPAQVPGGHAWASAGYLTVVNVENVPVVEAPPVPPPPG